MKLKKFWISLLSCIMCLNFIFPCSVNATNFTDASSHLSITIDYTHDGIPAKDVTFSIYYVAQMSVNLEFSWTEQFEVFDSMIDLGNLDQNEWNKTAQTLATYVQLNQMIPYDLSQTNEKGQLTFDNLNRGLYLIIANKHSMEGYTYSVMPTLVCLPNRNENGTWLGDVVIYPKYSEIGQASEVEVLKEWDDQNTSSRPKSIEVELLMDGVVVDVQELNVQNNWRYHWENLETGHEWKVSEKNVPVGYKVTITQQGTTILITNHKSVTPPDELENTGVLWWPVPVLISLGLLFILIGLLLNKKKDLS
ncbi:MAG: Cna B-type domain-containing protein [Traorella sp.]